MGFVSDWNIQCILLWRITQVTAFDVAPTYFGTKVHNLQYLNFSHCNYQTKPLFTDYPAYNRYIASNKSTLLLICHFLFDQPIEHNATKDYFQPWIFLWVSSSCVGYDTFECPSKKYSSPQLRWAGPPPLAETLRRQMVKNEIVDSSSLFSSS